MWLGILASALVAGCATSRPPPPTRVVVVLEGAKARAMTDQLISMFGEQSEIVPDADYRKAARTLKARKVSRRNVARIADAIGADAVIVGQVDRRRGRYWLYLQLREGATGKLDTIWKVRMRKAALGDKQRQELDGMMARIGAVPRLQPAPEPEMTEEAVARKEQPARKKDEPANKDDDKAAKQDDDKAAKQDDKKAAKKDDKRAAKKDDKKAAKKDDKVAGNDKGKKKPAAEEEEEEDPILEIKTDEKGQAIDDETPPGL